MMNKLDKQELADLRQWLINNIFQNPNVMFNDEMRTDLGINIDVDIIEVVAWLYELLHREVTNEEYDYMFHWANKIGAWVETKDIMEEDTMKKDNPIIPNRINYSDQNKNIPIPNKNIPNPNKNAKQSKKQSHPFRHQ